MLIIIIICKLFCPPHGLISKMTNTNIIVLHIYRAHWNDDTPL